MLVATDVSVRIIGSTLLALVGLALLWSGGRQYRRQRGAVSRAEQASGTIEAVGVQKIQDGTETAYIPTVEYEYQTPTQRLGGTTIYPGDSEYTKLYHSESAAESAIEVYEPGASTAVYYDPANPDHSFLEPTPHRAPNVAEILFGLGLMALSGFLIVQPSAF